MKYNTIEITGALLKAGFSIYLFEIRHEGKTYFYIGMTGDPFYPSARSGVHRLSGHLELNPKSTQNQLWEALKKQKVKESDLDSLKIIMHHFEIPGFKTWQGSLKNKKKGDFDGDPNYEAYKVNQTKVLALEKALIYRFKQQKDSKEILLNKTKGKKFEQQFEGVYKEVYDKVCAIVESKIGENE